MRKETGGSAWAPPRGGSSGALVAGKGVRSLSCQVPELKKIAVCGQDLTGWAEVG